MRISDWSSDVCSSDLVDPLGHDMEAVDEAPGEVGREGLEASIAKHIEQCRHHHLDSSAGLLRIGHLELFGFIDGGELGALVMLPESALVDRAAILISRSEEHTSELQSLMRISYTVFCLKKQTTSHTL